MSGIQILTFATTNGSKTVKLVPFPTSLSTVTSPRPAANTCFSLSGSLQTTLHETEKMPSWRFLRFVRSALLGSVHRDLPTLQSGLKLSHPNRLAEVVIHPRGKAFFAVSLHGVGRQSYNVERRFPRAWWI